MLPAIPLTQFNTGDQLYKYELGQRIGSGSFGEVWRAQDRAVGHEYAIKILNPGVPVHERLREAQIGHVLDHNNVVKVHQADVVQVGQQDYVIVAMDFMPNGPSTRMANPSHFLPVPDVVRLGKDIARGLEYLHGHDFFHNDVKPENVLIGPQHQGMLTDYGIVGVTQGGAPVQPPNVYKIHTAPEVLASNAITAQTDVFQTGLTLFRFAVGLDTLRQKFITLGEQAYYDAATNGKLVTAIDFPAFVPSRLRRVILKAVNPDLTERYQSALEMRRDLEKLNYPGYWTVEPNGDFVGYNGNYQYRYTQNKKSGNRFDVIALRRNIANGRDRRCGKFCHKDITNSVAQKEINKFIKAVVEGI